jgi:hypothetical protein
MSAAPEVEILEAQMGDGLGALIEATERELAELHRRRDSIDREIGLYARKLRMYEGVRRSLDGNEPAHLRLVTREVPPTKREAVLAFLTERPDEHFKLIEIRQGLIERGWMTSDKRGIHALEVAVTNMAARGEVHRVRKGIYALRPRTETLLDIRTDEAGE